MGYVNTAIIIDIKEGVIMLKPIASYAICNSLSINIKDIEYGIEDKVIWYWSNENKLHKAKIYNSRKGDYFMLNKTRFYLSDFCRI